MASAARKLDLNDLRSAARHFILPVLGGAVLAGLQVMQTGAVNLGTVKTAAISAAIAALYRLVHRYLVDMGAVNGNGKPSEQAGA